MYRIFANSVSINQSNFNSADITSSVARQPNRCNSKIDEVPEHHQAIGHAGVYGGKAKSKR